MLKLYTNINKPISVILAILMLALSCQEPYTNSNLHADDHIPVFNGLLSNLDNLNTFELYYAAPYTKKQPERINGHTNPSHLSFRVWAVRVITTLGGQIRGYIRPPRLYECQEGGQEKGTLWCWTTLTVGPILGH